MMADPWWLLYWRGCKQWKNATWFNERSGRQQM